MMWDKAFAGRDLWTERGIGRSVGGMDRMDGWIG